MAGSRGETRAPLDSHSRRARIETAENSTVPSTAPTAPAEPSFRPPDVQRLYEEHGEFVHALLSRLADRAGDPDDLTQEEFVVAWRHLRDFQGGSARAWLCRIALKVAADARRKAWFRRVLHVDATPALRDERTPEAVAQAREGHALAAAVLERMAEKKRTVFILYELQGLSGQEIADVLQCPLETVHTRLFHARREFVSQFEMAQADPVARGGRR